MFSNEELDCIVDYATMYRQTDSSVLKNKLRHLINIELRNKFPNLTLLTMCGVFTNLYPSINLSDILCTPSAEVRGTEVRKPYYTIPIATPVSRISTPVSQTSKVQPISQTDSSAKRFRELEERAKDLNISLSNYRSLTDKRFKSVNHTLQDAPSVDIKNVRVEVREIPKPDESYHKKETSSELLDKIRIRLGLKTNASNSKFSIQRGTHRDANSFDHVDINSYDREEDCQRKFDRSNYDVEYDVEYDVKYNTDWMDSTERDCFKTLSLEDKYVMMQSYTKMCLVEPENTYPLRMRVILSNIPDAKKLEIFNRLENHIPSFGEGPKYNAWVSSLLNIPFGKTTALPCRSDDSGAVNKFLTDARTLFDSEVYGHPKVKDEFISMLGSWIQAGGSCGQGNVIGVTGPVGVGKTTLAKGLASVMGRPFYFISLGGSCYASMLNGHGYTYEGAMCGEIARALMDTKCMDPVFFFDELDKVSSNGRGEEIIHLLIHLTDPTQNHNFVDRYFAGYPLDISKALFVFSYNDKDKVNPILRDRIHEIYLKDFNKEEKIVIVNEYVLPKICIAMNVDIEKLNFSPKAISHLVELCDKSTGIRLLKSILIRLIRIVVVAQMTEGKIIIGLDDNTNTTEFAENFKITPKIIDFVFKSQQEGSNEDKDVPCYMYI